VTHGWAPAEKCLTIYNGTDTELFDPQKNSGLRDQIRGEHGFVTEELAILVCGRLDQQKQCLLLPEIAQKFDELDPNAQWRIMVAGTGEFDEALKEKIQALGMNHRFCLLGWYPRPHELMAAADVKLLPSLWEGLPLTLIEAQASGLPIVASNIKGNREVVTEDTGFLCEPKNPDSYAESLHHLYQQSDLRKSMSRAARQRAESEFDIRQTFEKVDALYRDLLGAPARS
jgi:glycosyltransferase involved in cell wall biosynthesis